MKMSEIGSVDSRLEYKSDQTKLETNRTSFFTCITQHFQTLTTFKERTTKPRKED